MKKCNACRNNLLALERPDRPAASTAAHLAECVACRNWHRRLLLAERAVARLAVPPAEEARAALIRRLIAQPKPAATKSVPTATSAKSGRRSVAMVLGSWIMDPHASPRRRVGAGMVAGIAAVLLIALGGWWFWYLGHGAATNPVVAIAKPDSPLVAELRHKGFHVPDEQATPQERVKGMAAVADKLLNHSTTKSNSPAELDNLASLYEKVIHEEIVARSEVLAPADLDGLIKQFRAAESEASRSAANPTLSASEQKSFKKIAEASLYCHAELVKKQQTGVAT